MIVAAGVTEAAPTGGHSFSHIDAWIVSATVQRSSIRTVNCKNIQSFEGHTRAIQTLALCSGSEGEEFIASGSEDTLLRLWSLKTNPSIKPLQRHSDGVNCCTFSPDGTQLASGGNDDALHLWNVETGRAEKVGLAWASKF